MGAAESCHGQMPLTAVRGVCEDADAEAQPHQRTNPRRQPDDQARGSDRSTIDCGQNAGVLAPDLPIHTERLVLRWYESGDYDALHAIISRADVNRFLYTEPRDEDETAELLARKMGKTELLDEDDWLSVAVCLRETGELVGETLLHWVSEKHKVGEIGFMFHPDHHGRGYATEAARPLMGFGFEACGFHRIIGRLEARNAASARVLEKLGMRREALLIENEWVKGEWQSEMDYAILEREWRAQRDLSRA
jgi:RimJ/RimL family protein N-acetyltransferase